MVVINALFGHYTFFGILLLFIAQVEKLRSEAGHHSAQQRTRLKNRAADAKRIQDLERQVCNTVLFPVLY